MTPRSVSLLAGVAVIATLAAVWVWSVDRAATAAAAPRNEPMFPALAAPGTEVDAIDITTPDYHLALARQDGKWAATEHASYPADDQSVNRFLSEMAGLRATEAKTSDPTLYGKIGVEDVAAKDNKATLVHLIGKQDAELAKAILGNRSSSIGADPRGGTFVRNAGDAQAWLASGVVTMPVAAADWFAPLFNVPATDVKRVSVLAGDTTVFAAAKPDGQVIYQLQTATDAPAGASANDMQIKMITGNLLSVKMSDAQPLSAVQFAPDARSVQFETSTGLTLTARLGQLDGVTWVAFHASGTAGTDAAKTADAINARTDGFALKVSDALTLALQTPASQLVGPPGATPPAATAPAGRSPLFINP